MELINELDALVDNAGADELRDLQPLFERGLWIFGPEFESLSFTSNHTLSSILSKFFNVETQQMRKRPDFVVLPEFSIGTYTTDAYDAQHEVDGIESVIIIELKKGGFEIGYKEKDQAQSYSRVIRDSGKIANTTKITCYVLGSTISSNAEAHSHEGATTIIPMTYNTLIKRAKARTFQLLGKLEKYTSSHKHGELTVIAPELFPNP